MFYEEIATCQSREEKERSKSSSYQHSAARHQVEIGIRFEQGVYRSKVVFAE